MSSPEIKQRALWEGSLRELRTKIGSLHDFWLTGGWAEWQRNFRSTLCCSLHKIFTFFHFFTLFYPFPEELSLCRVFVVPIFEQTWGPEIIMDHGPRAKNITKPRWKCHESASHVLIMCWKSTLGNPSCFGRVLFTWNAMALVSVLMQEQGPGALSSLSFLALCQVSAITPWSSPILWFLTRQHVPETSTSLSLSSGQRSWFHLSWTCVLCKCSRSVVDEQLCVVLQIVCLSMVVYVKWLIHSAHKNRYENIFLSDSRRRAVVRSPLSSSTGNPHKAHPVVYHCRSVRHTHKTSGE